MRLLHYRGVGLFAFSASLNILRKNKNGSVDWESGSTPPGWGFAYVESFRYLLHTMYWELGNGGRRAKYCDGFASLPSGVGVFLVFRLVFVCWVSGTWVFGRLGMGCRVLGVGYLGVWVLGVGYLGVWVLGVGWVLGKFGV